MSQFGSAVSGLRTSYAVGRGTIQRSSIRDPFMEPRQAFLSRLRDYEPTTPLSREFYTSPNDYEIELEALWYRDWLFIGHDCEIARPGDYLTVQIGAYPVVVVRDRDGTVRAFHNSCRHRGARLCRDEHGHAPRLVCPYHQWTYRLDGALLVARDMGEPFDRSQHGLRAVHCATVGGYIWVCLGKVAPEFEPLARQVEPYLRPHRLHEAKVAFESTIVERANWKLVWENNRECYHCPANHPELSRTFPATPTVANPELAAGNTRAVEQWSLWETRGLPSRFQLSANGQSRVVRMSLIDGAVSYTMDGRAAVRRPLSDSVTDDAGALLMFHYASTWNHLLADHAVSFRVLPLGPTETQLTTKWLVHKDAQAGVDYDLARLTEVWLATNDEDRRICQENQLGVNSPGYAPGPYSPIQEAGVMQFVRWYRDHLVSRLTEEPG
jgi:glycine betaine catabolism A